MDHKQKVYINPNFKRVTNSLSQNSQSSLHLNPNFRQQVPQIQMANVANQTRIFVNPNFIRPNYNTVNRAIGPTLISIENTDRNSQINAVQTLYKPAIAPPVNNEQSSSCQITKSRYSIVRHNNENKITETQAVKLTTTFKLNKYKSVPILDIRKTLDTSKGLNKPVYKSQPKQKSPQVSTTRCKKHICTTPYMQQSRFKFVKQGSESKPESRTKVNRKPSGNLPRNLQSNHRTKIKINKKHFKKNNIPCPLFRKYGKCLRHAQGNCELLHDKKHVSICRRFLNGSCHAENCLLSHDLTTKKMPTCSFYLKGMCTKDGCPYLHVKLNEKTKICTDFVKGYCEKGHSCLDRHINICPEIASKGVCFRKQCPYPHKSNKTQVRQIKSKTRTLNRSSKSSSQIRRLSKSENNETHSDKESNTAECSRYYKEVTTNSTSGDTCEVIKPSRCKLGTLPSFIQL